MTKRRNLPPNRYGCKPQEDVCLAHSLPLVGRYWCEKSWRHHRQPIAGDVYTKADLGEHRRVVFVGEYMRQREHTPDLDAPSRGMEMVHVWRVCYSNGTDTNHWCNLDTFMDWVRTAKLEKEGGAA